MTLRSIGRLLLLSMLLVPATLGARQTFKSGELPKADVKAPAAPKLSITTEAAQGEPTRLEFESEWRGIKAHAKDVKITYTKVGLEVELSEGGYTSRQGMFARGEKMFGVLLLEFGSNGDLVTEKVVR